MNLAERLLNLAHELGTLRVVPGELLKVQLMHRQLLEMVEELGGPTVEQVVSQLEGK